MTPDLNNIQTIALSTAIVGTTLLLLLVVLTIFTWRRQIENFLVAQGILIHPQPLRPAPFPAHYVLPYRPNQRSMKGESVVSHELRNVTPGLSHQRSTAATSRQSSDKFPPHWETPDVPRTPTPPGMERPPSGSDSKEIQRNIWTYYLDAPPPPYTLPCRPERVLVPSEPHPRIEDAGTQLPRRLEVPAPRPPRFTPASWPIN
ncbi:hypothetical protein ARMSODRAFT_1020834 [Armillaria solidipes]|uniref:Uncharacterized protein n=1 Tax=Armillaria solidipes TaxID=1076256 RepID=A0A2H3BWC2_9AGAR|nr:hypothetical protein ARMSODRAFT_1020834 [Armillaria solidipes]